MAGDLAQERERERREAGEVIRARREELGLTQEQVVRNTTISTESSLSAYESGKLGIGRSKHLPSIAAYLRLTEDQLRQINPSAVIEVAAPHPLSPAALGYRDIPKRTVEIPDELRDAAEQYGHMPMFSDLRERRWQVFMADMPRKRTPSDVEGWLQDFARLKEMGIEPEES